MKSQKSQVPTQCESDPEAAHWINRELISEDIRRGLLFHLEKSALTKERQARFLDSCNSICNMVASSTPAKAADDVQTQIKKIRDAAKRLINSLNTASDEALSALAAHGEYLVLGSNPPVRMPEAVRDACRRREARLVPTGKDYAEAIHMAADYAHDQIDPSRHSQPSKNAAKGLIWHVARSYRAASGALPPSSRNGWFCPFMDELGGQIGLTCGPRLVEGVIRDLASCTH